MSEDPALNAKREEKIKEQLLDEVFKKAEISRGVRPPNKVISKKKSYEKTFPKVGILIIIIAIIGLVFINTIPWVYARYNDTEAAFYKNFESKKDDQQVRDLFKSPYYLGLSINDFTNAPALATYGFISLIILGIAITIFGILDKIRDFSIETFTIIHFTAATAIIIPGIFIILSSTKILGAHFLLYHNMSLITTPHLKLLFFPAAFAVVVIGFVIIRLAFTIMRMDFNELEKMKETEISEKPFSSYTYGGELQ